MPLGISFAPGADIQMNGQNGSGAAPSRLSPQQAVKILSLRVPESLPSNAPVNRALLTSPGGSAAGASGLQSLIQQLIQSFQPQTAGAPVMPSESLPSQSIPMQPTQAPMTGPSQDVSQGPSFTGYQGDVPTDPMFHPMVGGGGRPGGGGGDFGSQWQQAVQSWANQSMQGSLPMPHFDIGENLFGTGVAMNRNT